VRSCAWSRHRLGHRALGRVDGVTPLVKAIDRIAAVCSVINKKNPRPLAIGIHKHLRPLLPDLSGRQFNIALHHYTRSADYLRELIRPGAARYNADGSISAPVDADAVEAAMKKLAKLESKSEVKRLTVEKIGPSRPLITLKKKHS
jgi:sRNA-binding protein